ncbi:hypothetical protein ACFL5Z_09120, partial [Planctomycetota bacterium]
LSILRNLMNGFKKRGNFAIAPEWLKAYISKDNPEVPKQEKEFDRCYSAYYRFAISPYKEKTTEYKKVRLPENNNEVSISDDAIISLCTYNRFNPDYSVIYPDDFINWLSLGRINKANAIDPQSEPCNSIMCCRNELNSETAQNIDII